MNRSNDEDGIILVWVALMMAVLLGFAALVIDFGAYQREKRELQNGADAAALAAAKDCGAMRNCASTARSTAASYANGNAHDGTSTTSVCGSGGGLPACSPAPAGTSGLTNWVQVTTSTRSPDGGDQVDFMLAPVVGAVAGAGASESAVARWGPPDAVKTPPFAISLCAYQNAVESAADLPSGSITLYLNHDDDDDDHDDDDDDHDDDHDDDDEEECEEDDDDHHDDDQDEANFFAWIQSVGNTCQVSLSVPGMATSAPEQRAGGSKDCFRPTSRSNSVGVGDVVTVGLYTPFNDGRYRIVGVAAFKISAYYFDTKGTKKAVGLSRCPDRERKSCLQGTFELLVLPGGGQIGGSTNFGVSVVKMVG